jgi:dihydrofolate synthase/folylpolyglutamate synthase
MSYAAAIDQLNAMTPELYIRPGQPRRKFSLDQVHTLLAALDDPHTRYPSVLIAGTNGKGSTASTLASILTASGFRTGLYTSPHLERVNERIRVDRVLIPDDDFARLYFRIHATAEDLVARVALPQHPSFFECLTALAFLYFAEQAVDIAVLEVGMGGRLDATNVVEPLLSVITDISLDHTEWLGPTITDITREKAGILRPHGTLITLPQHPEANQALGEIAAALDVRGVSATPYMPPLHADPAAPYPVEIQSAHIAPTEIEVASPLTGAHQHRNVALAIATALELANLLPSLSRPVNEPSPSAPEREAQLAPREVVAPRAAVTPASIAAGIRTTSWPGRLEVIHSPVPPFPTSQEHSSKTEPRSRDLGAKSTDPSRKATGYIPRIEEPKDESASDPEGAAPRSLPASEREAQLAPREVQWILDVAHNPAGAWALRAGLSSLLHLNEPGAAPVTLVFSCLRDKPLAEMAQILFPLFERVIFAPIHSARAASLDDLLAAAAATGTPAQAADSVAQALALAASAPNNLAETPSSILAGKREAPNARSANAAVVVISGSVYLVGEARSLLLRHPNESCTEPRP